jgi:hypothetical protein
VQLEEILFNSKTILILEDKGKIHVDCHNRLDLKIGEKIHIEKGVSNWRLNNLLGYLKSLISQFPEDEQNRVNKGLLPFINGIKTFDFSNAGDIGSFVSDWHTKNTAKLGEDPELLINLNKLRTESIFEQMRQSEFPNKISRLESIYLAYKAEDWIKMCESSYTIYEFSIEEAEVEGYDSFWYTSSGDLEIEEVKSNAKKYWAEEKSPSPKMEFLAIGDLLVIDKIMSK